MSIIYVLIPIAMIFVAIAVLVFFWAVKSNQYDDLDREGVNILFDEDMTPSKTSQADLTDTENSEQSTENNTPMNTTMSATISTAKKKSGKPSDAR
ncbi:cbb3-type cytochrome oxidase assembly protein CcoS [uncultured Psychromonas sp.]|uniref:cbb3-type cytochrome oxidase assembly protein CcoS n=1 Tax=uncultured Psychromonas sp. TaxID=173974 RepID=UPI0026058D78|nr:cbb3-type cytochrome oxidase assembly protein CcoS [uncultured Psychromonas sp.]